jgi:hypothetical protein
VVCLGYDAFLIFALRGLIFSDAPGELWLLFFLAIVLAIVLHYSVVALCLNQTIITINPNTITVKHGPLPFLWYDNKEFATSTVMQLSVRKVDYELEDQPQTYYQVWVLLQNGVEMVLVNYLQKLSDASSIAQEIELFLRKIRRGL